MPYHTRPYLRQPRLSSRESSEAGGRQQLEAARVCGGSSRRRASVRADLAAAFGAAHRLEHFGCQACDGHLYMSTFSPSIQRPAPACVGACGRRLPTCARLAPLPAAGMPATGGAPLRPTCPSGPGLVPRATARPAGARLACRAPAPPPPPPRPAPPCPPPAACAPRWGRHRLRASMGAAGRMRGAGHWGRALRARHAGVGAACLVGGQGGWMPGGRQRSAGTEAGPAQAAC